MITIDLGDAAEPTAEAVIAAPVIAAIAAHAAVAVPGVVRTQPGLRGLATSVARAARQRIQGLTPAPADGVRVLAADPDEGRAGVRVEVGVVLSGQDQAAAVAQAVQRAVTRAVEAATSGPVASVSVTILDVETPEVRR
ncbi:Asp23/Gls24 family envelope stress response protein [Amycolatopsis endophytica]|uniref:Putative alkaline shock family protein YloU n=1 Tax=Amycolatopsis endophytica TaxID=860233 RepID=A0A853B936_9PSEU|nr:Asp23/Gls24 family envelope stress response protein [Amycolatopsis endophytica]NYI91520.1 putative alkaline shock family protein YloU [Amycolatopsis endophytica]